jgi:NitT/TauT family transport system substrate-binding protein
MQSSPAVPLHGPVSQARFRGSAPGTSSGPRAAALVSRRTLLAGALAVGAAGCSARSAAQHPGPEKPNLTVALVPAITNVGLFLAQSHGFFAAEGLTVKVVPVISSTAAVTEQLHGRIDVTAGAYVSYILAQANNPGAIAWRILAEGSVSQAHSQQVLIARRSPVRTVADLKGKTVGVNIVGNTGTLLIDAMLAQSNVPVSLVTQAGIPFPHLAGALASGKIEAGWFDEPFLSEAEAAIGAQQLYDTDSGATQNFPISGYMVTEQWARRYPRTAGAFTRAITRGQALADADRAAAEAACVTFIKGLTRQVAAVLTFDQYPTGIDPVRLQRVPDVMHQFGLLANHFDITAMTRQTA